jgi:hypothetical protein
MDNKLKNAFLKRIEKTNELFNSSTPEEKRVMIAQDCIDRIKAKLLDPQRQRIIRLPNWAYVNKENVNSITCEVCAKGGLLASYVGRVNNFDESSNISNNDDNIAHNKLLEIFTLEQLAIIENAFEGVKYILSVDISDSLGSALRKFYLDYETDEERLIAICENIIKNNGDFVLQA